MAGPATTTTLTVANAIKPLDVNASTYARTLHDKFGHPMLFSDYTLSSESLSPMLSFFSCCFHSL